MEDLDIDKIVIKKLNTVNNNKGNIMHCIKKSSKEFIDFGEAYFSWINKDCVKGWKFHNKMHLHLFVPVGNIKFVFISNIDNSKNRVEEIGEKNYCLLSVPPKIWFGFKNLDSGPSLLLNIASIEHDTNEYINKPTNYFSYDW